MRLTSGTQWTFCQISWLKIKTSKNGVRICKWKSTDNKDINIFLSLENPCTFLLAKEKTQKCIFNTNSKLSQNRTEKQIMLFKVIVNELFNDIWCYLVISCFVWKIAVFNKQLQEFYCILKEYLEALWNYILNT